MAKKGTIPWNKGKKLSENHVELIRMTSQDRHGEDSSNWQGGRTKLVRSIRSSYLYKNWKARVFGNADWKCQSCGVTNNLMAHHKISFLSLLKKYGVRKRKDIFDIPELWDENNGMILCCDCHQRTDNYGGRTTWRKNEN